MLTSHKTHNEVQFILKHVFRECVRNGTSISLRRSRTSNFTLDSG